MIVITNPTPITDEIQITHSLFEEGLELLHVRKPDFSEAEIKTFLLQIKSDFRAKMVLHSHHQLAEKFGINRIHFSEKKRKETTKLQLEELKIKGFRLSTSVHSIEKFNDLDTLFEYAFLSPVFPSISKENYQPEADLFKAIKKRTNFKTKLISLGGIEAGNINQAYKAGIDGVALLGTIWNQNNPIENFKLCQQIVHSY